MEYKNEFYTVDTYKIIYHETSFVAIALFVVTPAHIVQNIPLIYLSGVYKVINNVHCQQSRFNTGMSRCVQ